MCSPQLLPTGPAWYAWPLLLRRMPSGMAPLLGTTLTTPVLRVVCAAPLAAASCPATRPSTLSLAAVTSCGCHRLTYPTCSTSTTRYVGMCAKAAGLTWHGASGWVVVCDCHVLVVLGGTRNPAQSFAAYKLHRISQASHRRLACVQQRRQAIAHACCSRFLLVLVDQRWRCTINLLLLTAAAAV